MHFLQCHTCLIPAQRAFARTLGDPFQPYPPVALHPGFTFIASASPLSQAAGCFCVAWGEAEDLAAFPRRPAGASACGSQARPRARGGRVTQGVISRRGARGGRAGGRVPRGSPRQMQAVCARGETETVPAPGRVPALSGRDSSLPVLPPAGAGPPSSFCRPSPLDSSDWSASRPRHTPQAGPLPISAATMCVGNEKIAFLAFFYERPRGCTSRISGPKARNFFGSLCLDDCLTTIPVIYCEVCLCPWTNKSFVE